MDETVNWEQVRELFLTLADLSEAERGERLERLQEEDPEAAQQVMRLLANDQEENPTEPPRFERIGPYEIVRSIGKGGMGEVFVARRGDGEYEREVAIKLLNKGSTDRELVQRFLRERQMLARLDHEYIAELLDGGTTEKGTPYIVMEYVDGVPAHEFAAKLPLEERIELFLRIGEAVEHSHQHGFIHRDLKPSNVLVRPDGAPRLLDFGIAKVAEEKRHESTTERIEEQTLTQTGHRLFTPSYASPEQVRAEKATLRSDIFSLGVMLYVFLCGKSPWPRDVPLMRLELAICQDDPSPPSRNTTGRTSKRLKGDLDAIVLQCLAKDPLSRYASVADLCEDLRRYLKGLPIQARRTGVFGRSIRLARRRPAVPALLLLGLATTVALALAWQAEQRDLRRYPELMASVRRRIDQSRSLRSAGKFEEADIDLDAALAVLEQLPPAPGLRGEVLAQKGLHAHLRGEHERAVELVDRAEALLSSADEPAPWIQQIILNVRMLVAEVLRPDGVGKAVQVSLAHARDHLPLGSSLRIDAEIAWANELRREGRSAESLDALRGLADQLRALDPHHTSLIMVLNVLGTNLHDERRFEESVQIIRKAIECIRWHHGEQHRDFALLRSNLALGLLSAGQEKEARAEFERSNAAARQAGRLDVIARNQEMLSQVYLRAREFELAERAVREAVGLNQELYDEPAEYATSRCRLGIVLMRRSKAAEGVPLLQSVFAVGIPARVDDMLACEALYLLGAWLQDHDQGSEAGPYLQKSYELAQRVMDENNKYRLEIKRRASLSEGE